jgi:hypothetical protein
MNLSLLGAAGLMLMAEMAEMAEMHWKFWREALHLTLDPIQ